MRITVCYRRSPYLRVSLINYAHLAEFSNVYIFEIDFGVKYVRLPRHLFNFDNTVLQIYHELSEKKVILLASASYRLNSYHTHLVFYLFPKLNI